MHGVPADIPLEAFVGLEFNQVAHRIHMIIDVPITAFEVDPPRSFTIVFQDGQRLSVFDDNPRYEAFSIHLDGQQPMYV